MLETDHLWGLHVNSCVLTLSELLSGFSAYLDDGFEYCPPTGPLPTTKIIWINRCLDKETRLDEDRFSICMTQKLASKEKKKRTYSWKKSIFETNPPQPNSIYNVTLFLFWQLYDEKSVKLAFWSRYEDTYTIGGIRTKIGLSNCVKIGSHLTLHDLRVTLVHNEICLPHCGMSRPF